MCTYPLKYIDMYKIYIIHILDFNYVHGQIHLNTSMRNERSTGPISNEDCIFTEQISVLCIGK